MIEHNGVEDHLHCLQPWKDELYSSHHHRNVEIKDIALGHNEEHSRPCGLWRNQDQDELHGLRRVQTESDIRR